MKAYKKIRLIFLCVCLIISNFTLIKAVDINNDSVFLKQGYNSVTCTLVSNAMMLRRKALLLGRGNWSSITEASLRNTAWIDNVGMKNSYSYDGISVTKGYFGTNKQQELIDMLKSHPEGIVIYATDIPHAILVTDYTGGMFYAADPSPYYAAGRIPISRASISINQAKQFWYVTGPNYPIPDATQTRPFASVNQQTGLVSFSWPAIANAASYNVVPRYTDNTQVGQYRVTNPAFDLKLTKKGVYYMAFSAESSLGYSDSKSVEYLYRGIAKDYGDSKYVRIKAKNNGNFLYYDVDNNVLGTRALSTSNSEYNKYVFKLERVNNENVYKIKSAYDPSKVLDFANDGNYDATHVQLINDTGHAAQKFVMTDSDYGGTVINKAYGMLVLDNGTSSQMKGYRYTTWENNNQIYDIINVKPNPTSVSMSDTNITLEKNKSKTLSVSLTPIDSNAQIKWRVGNSAIASVDSKGKITAKKCGNTYVYAKTVNGLETRSLVKVSDPATSIAFGASVYSVPQGSTNRLTVKVNPSTATQEVTWRAGNNAVASVDKNGNVTGKSMGKTYIYAKASNGKEAKVLLTVIGPLATSIKLNSSKISLNVHATETLSATVSPSTASNKSIAWSIGNPKIATVDKSGKVTAKSVGNTYVYAKTSNGKTVKCLVNVTAIPTNVKINSNTITMSTGYSKTMSATVSPATASQAVSWRTGNSNIASVDKNGKLTAKKIGNTYLYASTTNGKEARILVKVVQGASSIKLNMTTKTVYTPESVQLYASVSPANTVNKKVTWTSSDSNIASVSSNGKVDAKAAGTVNITAYTSNGKSAAFVLKVNQKRAPVPNGNYTFASPDNKFALSVPAGNAYNGAPLNEWQNINGIDQNWYIDNIGNNKFVIRSALNNNLVLDVYHTDPNNIYTADETGNPADGKVAIYTYHDPMAQEWVATKYYDGSYSFHLASKSQYYLTRGGNFDANGNRIYMFKGNLWFQNQWQLTRR